MLPFELVDLWVCGAFLEGRDLTRVRGGLRSSPGLGLLIRDREVEICRSGPAAVAGPSGRLIVALVGGCRLMLRGGHV